MMFQCNNNRQDITRYLSKNVLLNDCVHIYTICQSIQVSAGEKL